MVGSISAGTSSAASQPAHSTASRVRGSTRTTSGYSQSAHQRAPHPYVRESGENAFAASPGQLAFTSSGYRSHAENSLEEPAPRRSAPTRPVLAEVSDPRAQDPAYRPACCNLTRRCQSQLAHWLPWTLIPPLVTPRAPAAPARGSGSPGTTCTQLAETVMRAQTTSPGSGSAVLGSIRLAVIRTAQATARGSGS